MPFEKRTKSEKDTLIFPSPEKAQEFTAEVGEKLSQQTSVVKRGREIVAEAVAEELTAAGENHLSLDKPWQHTPEEHAEVQTLVDKAFATDLTKALKEARGSNHYPRNIDLLHDTLTTELYEAMLEHKLNKQPVLIWLMMLLGTVILVAIIILFMWLAA